MSLLLQNPMFYCRNKDTYPPFKNGFYLEEFFLQNFLANGGGDAKRTYIPVLWTNFQLYDWFPQHKAELQRDLDAWIQAHPNPQYGYYTVVQQDDGPLLKLPPNTVVFGACSGNIPIPLIYEDQAHTLQKVSNREFAEKRILCSFVGNVTANDVAPNVRAEMFRMLGNNPKFAMINSGGWSPEVNRQLQEVFIETTKQSRFALAPRGYGRSSFRFFECFLLGAIPVYIWNDANWLPFQDQIDYSRLCVVLHVSELGRLEGILDAIGETQYNQMWAYYETIRHFFTLEGMTAEILRILSAENTISPKIT